MSKSQQLESVRPSLVNVLVRDHMMQLAAWVLAVEAVIYAVPLLGPGSRMAFGAAGLSIPFVALAVAATLLGLDGIEDRVERQFWAVMGFGCLAWMLTMAGMAVFPSASPNATREILVDAGFLVFYVASLLAAEMSPHVARAQGQRHSSWKLRGAGLIVVVFGWYACFVIVPASCDPMAGGASFSSAMLFVVLDAITVVRFAVLTSTCRSPRWQVLYGSVAAAMITRLAIDSLEALVSVHAVQLTPGASTDLIWAVPPLALLVAFRMRQLPWRRVDMSAGHAEAGHNGEPAQAASILFGCAAGFPIVQFVLHAAGTTSPVIESAQRGVALAAMLLVGGLAMITYRVLERDRVATERAREMVEERLRTAKKMEALARLSSTVTHEFLNLLNAIGGYVDLTLDSMRTDDANTENLRRAHDVVRRTTQFTKRLLVLSRGQPFHATSVALNQTIRDLIPDLQELVTPPAVVEASLGTDAGRVAIAADYLREVLTNLVSNSGDAMPHGGRLTIDASWVDVDPQSAFSLAIRPGPYGKVVVRDTGPGIPKDVLAHLFEPFFTTKPKPRARGLGMATVYVVVTQHGGTVSVKSEQGIGTAVEFLLPAWNSPPRAGSPIERTGVTDGSGRA